MDMPSTTIPETNRLMPAPLAARGETPAAFGRRCIPAGCVAPRSNTPGILARRALPSGRIAALGATLEFHHGLLGLTPGPGRAWVALGWAGYCRSGVAAVAYHRRHSTAS